MKSKILLWLAVLGSASGLFSSDFTLVEGNQAKSVILLPGKSPDAVAAAVGNFNRTLETVTGTQLPVVQNDTPGNRIVLTVRKVDSLETADNFIISFPDRRTMCIEGTEVSVQWAFNHLIREYAGAEWILPVRCGLSYTPMKDLKIPAKRIEVKDISWPISRTHSTRPVWWKQNLREGVRIGHDFIFHAFPLEKYGKDNSWPEAVMPVLNGKKITSLPNPNRPKMFWQPCYSNPETVRIAAENIFEYLKKNPLAGISLGANDCYGFCECSECLKLDHNDLVNRSESYFTFINRVMERLCRKYPNLTVSVLAYHATFLPPSFKLHPNVVVYLTIDFNSCISPEQMKRHRKVIDEWSRKASALGIWDYSWGYPYPVPRLYLPLHLEMLQYVHSRKGKAYYSECWTEDGHEGPKLYLIEKLLWNSRQDFRKLEEDWYVRCVGGKAAPYLKAYFAIWNDYFMDRVKLTPWFRSASSVYMAFNDVSCIYALRENDIESADNNMKKVVELAETPQEKQRAGLMMDYWIHAKLRLRLLGAGIYEPSGLIRTPEQAAALLDTVLKSPAYLKEYRQISTRLAQEKIIQGYYLSKPWMRSGGTPVNRNFDLNLSRHILIAAQFAAHKTVNAKLNKIAKASNLPGPVRALAAVMSDQQRFRNFLPDGNAEQGLTPQFVIHPDLQNAGALSVTEKYASSGKKSFQIEIKDPFVLFQAEAAGLNPGKRYVCSFKAFIPKSSAEGYMVTRSDVKPAVKRSLNGLDQLKLSEGSWQPFSILTAPVSSSGNLLIQFYLCSFEKGDKIYIDDIQLKEIGGM